MLGGLGRIDVPTSLSEDESDLRLVIHLGGGDEPRRPSVERLKAHRRDGFLRPDDVQRISVVIRGQPVPFRRDLGPRGGTRPGDMGPECEEVSQQAWGNRREHPHIARLKRPRRRVGPDLFRIGEDSRGPLPHVAFELGARVDEAERVRRDPRVGGGEVHDPFPVVPGAQDGTQARRRTGRGKSDELHATPLSKRKASQCVSAATTMFSPHIMPMATPSLRPRAAPAGCSRTS